MPTVHESLAAGLAAAGVRTVFGLMGSGTDQLTRELVEHYGVRYVATRHEHGAVAMADGFSRVGEGIGVALVSADAGLTNSMTALVTARLAGSRVLAIVGDQASSYKSDQTRLDQIPLESALGITTIPVSAATVQRDLLHALRELDLDRGPVILNVAWDVSNAEDTGSESRHELRPTALRRDYGPSESTLDDVMGLIALARRPLVLAGRGAIRSAAGPILTALARSIGALTATTLPARGYFADDEFDVGVCGSFATDDVARLISETDLVLSFGAGLNAHTRGHGGLFGRARIVQIDLEPAVLGRRGPINIGVIGDAAAVARRLLESSTQLGELTAEERGRSAEGWRTAETKHQIANLDKWRGVDLHTESDGYANPYAVMRACDELLPTERLVAIDIGYFMSYAGVYLESGSAPSMVCPWEYGAIGCALGPAIGAALARPDLYPVMIIGDGGMAATMNELDTVIRCGIPMLIVVMDDGGFRAERELFRRREQSFHTADTPSPDFAGVARALGFDSHTVTAGTQMREVLAELPPDRACLIRVMVHPTQPNPEMVKAMQG